MSELREIVETREYYCECGAPALFEHTHKWDRKLLCRECMLEMRLKLIQDIYKELEAADE